MFEAQTQKLRNLKKEFEQAQQWTESTICRLRYQTFVEASISYGTEFYLFPPDYILDLYSAARKEGLDDAILDMLLDQYYETKYRNNPDQLHRSKILTHLNPFRHLTKTQVQAMYTAGQIGYPEFMVKVNFSTYIARFERENTSVLLFGDALAFDAKIKAISKTLIEYGKENQPEQPAGTGAGEGFQSTRRGRKHLPCNDRTAVIRPAYRGKEEQAFYAEVPRAGLGSVSQIP